MRKVLSYPQNEIELLNAINKLMSKWKKLGSMSTLFVSDGFYPFYTNQRIKILFIGREGIDLAGKNYIEELYKSIKNGRIGNCHLNSHKFHSRMLRITYAIENRTKEDIPQATEISKTFGTEGGISYAFMNISKLSHESQNGDWKTKMELVNRFLEENNNIEYLQKEVSLLNPDIIIGMNLGTLYNKLGKRNVDDVKFFGEVKKDNNGKEEDGNVSLQKIEIAGKEFILIDSYHFSYFGVKDKDIFLKPITEAVEFYEKNIRERT